MHRPPRARRTNGSMIGERSSSTRARCLSSTVALSAGLVFLLSTCPMSASAVTSASKATPSPLEREAQALYEAANFSRVVDLIQHPPAGQEPGAKAIRYAVLSFVKMGKPEEAWKQYPKLTSGDRPDDLALLREIARSFIVSRVRDPQEHIRIAAYTALAEMGDRDTLPLLEERALGFVGPRSRQSCRSHWAERIGRALRRTHTRASG